MEWGRSCSRLLPRGHRQVDAAAQRGTGLENPVAERKREVDVRGKRVAAPVPVHLGLMPRRSEREVDAMHRRIEGRPGHLLQVHDELVFEVPDKEIDALAEVAIQVMEKAALPAVHLSVPLTVDARAAENWDAAH